MREGTGNKNAKPDSWHYNHMIDPRTMSPGSIMPQYPQLADNELDLSLLPAKITALRKLGTPYPHGYESRAVADAQQQAKKIAARLKEEGIKDENMESKEMVALIAYLQRLGTDINVK